MTFVSSPIHLLTQTCLDLVNDVLMRTSGSNINKLQRVQNCLARVVLQDNYNSAISLLSELQWLPVSKRINFNIATLAYQSLAFGQPTYLSLVLTPLTSLSCPYVYQNLLSVPRCNSSFGQISFPILCP